MSKVLDANAAPSTALAVPEPEDGFAEFQREQREARKNSKSVELKAVPEVAPASEPVVPAAEPKGEPVTPKQEALTDEEKSARKHANDEKRIPKLYERLSEKDAEIARLNRELAAKGTSATPTKDAAKPEIKEDPNDPAPNPDAFKGDNAWRDFLRAEASWITRQEIKKDHDARTAAEAKKQADAVSGSFMERMNAYREALPANPNLEGKTQDQEFIEEFEIVKTALETEFPAVSSAIAGHEKAPELIHYLGSDLDLFSKITSAKGQPMAMKIFRSILAEFEKPTVSEEQPRKSLPKPPVSVVGRGHTPTADDLLTHAAENDDFTTAQTVFASQRNQKRR